MTAKKDAARRKTTTAKEDSPLRGEIVPLEQAPELRRAALVGLPSERRLVRFDEPLPSSLAGSSALLEDLAAAGRLAERSIASSTAVVYDKGLTYWEQYCAQHDVAPYPPVAGVVMAWVASMANRKVDDDGKRVTGTGLHHKTIVQRIAALNKMCAAHGWPKPGDNPEVAEVLAGCRRTLGVRARRPVAPMDLTVMREVLGVLQQPTPMQLRDRAVFLLSQHPQVRVGALANIEWSHIDLDDTSVTVFQPPQSSRGKRVAIRIEATGTVSCPVAAVRAWRMACVQHSRWLVPLIGAAGVSEQGVKGREGVHHIVRRVRGLVGASGDLTVEQLDEAVVLLMQPGLLELRDRCALLSSFFTAGRRSNIVRLTFHDMRFIQGKGVSVLFDRTKTDQDGAGTIKWLPFGKTPETCAVTAFRQWHQAVCDALGYDPSHSETPIPVFPILTKGGTLQVGPDGVPVAITGTTFAAIVRRRAAAAGYDPSLFAGHSMRAGFITAAAEQNLRIDQIQQVSDHKNVSVLMGYIRQVDSWRDNPAAAIGL